MAFAEYPVVSGGSGGITKVADSIERNALTPADGDIIIQLDNDFLYEWNGSSWAVLADRTWQTAGSILGAKTFDTASTWSVATNQQVFGVTNTTTVNYAAPSANRVYTVPDVGADAAYVMTAGNQTIGGTKTFSSTITGSISGNAGTVTNGAYVNVGNVFTLAQSITASSNQLVLYSGVNQLTLNSGTSAAARTYTVPDTGTTDTFAMLGGTQSFTGAKTFSSTITATNSSAPLTLNVGSSSNAELLFTSSATQPDLYINFRSTGTGPQSWLLGLNPSGISSNAFGIWDNTLGSPVFTVAPTTNVSTFYANLEVNTSSNQLALSSGVNLLTLNSGTSAAARTYTVPDVGTSATFAMLPGSQTFTGAKTFSSAVTINPASNQLVLSSGVSQLTLNSGTSAAARTYTVPDTGTTDTFAMLGGSQTFGGAKSFSSAVTVSAASNQLVLSSGVNQLTLNSSTSAAARTYAFPDVGTSGTVAMLEGAQTFSALKTFSSGLAVSGGSAANNTIWVASNVLNIRGGTSGTDIYNTSGSVIVDIADTGIVTIGPNASTANNLAVNGSFYMATVGSSYTASASFPYIGAKTSSIMLATGGSAGNYIFNGIYYDGSYKHSTANTAGALSLTTGVTSLSNDAWAVYTSNSISHSADSAATLVKIGSTTHTGAWTLGIRNTASYAGVAIAGRTNGTAITSGDVGESQYSYQSTFQNAAGTATYSDITSITLTAGVWDISAIGHFNLNGATMNGAIRLGIATTSGATATGLVIGENAIETAPQTSTYDNCASIASWRVNITSSTTYYLKQWQQYSAGTPRARGRISATRVA